MATSFLDRWVNRLKASAREEIQETARSALLYAVAAAAALAALLFLTLAAFWWLEAELSAVAAALVLTVFYSVAAAVVLIWASWSSGAAPVAEPPPQQRADVRDMPSQQRNMVDRMGVNLDGVARTLAGAGFRTESLVVTASSELARQLSPLQLVGLVFVGSFLFGRRLRRR
ncbi:MAG: phage holin family protein [Hyphomicrobiaceae bacterium]|nr:phage holin family protein [Hyphomicrobiaceae bacterium]